MIFVREYIIRYEAMRYASQESILWRFFMRKGDRKWQQITGRIRQT